MLTPSRMEWVKAWEQDLAPSAAARRSAARIAARVDATRYYGRQATAPALPDLQPRAKADQVAPRLRVVKQRRPQWKAVSLALVTVAVLVACCFVTPVLLRAATTDAESAIGKLQVKQEQLRAENMALGARISFLRSPLRVSEQAAQLGLGPAQSVHYLELSQTVAAAEEIGANAGW